MLIKNTQIYINHTLAKVAVTQLSKTKWWYITKKTKKNLFKSDHTLTKVAVTQLKDKVVVPNKNSQKSVP
jgi:hypothetical protein